MSEQPASPRKRTGLWIGVAIAAVAIIGAAIAIPVAISNAEASQQQAEQAARDAELEADQARLNTFYDALKACNIERGEYVKVLDLGEWWLLDTGLPLPLGVNVARRDLGEENLRRLSGILRDSIEAGLRDFVLPYTAIRNRGRGYAVSIVKAGVRIAGRPAGPVRPPLTELDAKSYADLQALMEKQGDRAPGSPGD